MRLGIGLPDELRCPPYGYRRGMHRPDRHAPEVRYAIGHAEVGRVLAHELHGHMGLDEVFTPGVDPVGHGQVLGPEHRLKHRFPPLALLPRSWPGARHHKGIQHQRRSGDLPPRPADWATSSCSTANRHTAACEPARPPALSSSAARSPARPCPPRKEGTGVGEASRRRGGDGRRPRVHHTLRNALRAAQLQPPVHRSLGQGRASAASGGTTLGTRAARYWPRPTCTLGGPFASWASALASKIESSCCTSLLYDAEEPQPDHSDWGSELRWTCGDLNPRPPRCERGALPDCATGPCNE